MKKLLSFILIIAFCVSLAACQVTPEEPSSTPVSEPISKEESSTSKGSGGLPLAIDNRTAVVKFGYLDNAYVDYAIENLGHVQGQQPTEGNEVWDILSFIAFLGLSKEDFIAVNEKNLDRYGDKEFTNEEIDILFGDDERAKRELVSPCCIFIGEGPITSKTPYYTALWYAEHSVDEWIEVGTPREDMIRLHDRLGKYQSFDSYREAFEEKYKEFLDRVKE